MTGQAAVAVPWFFEAKKARTKFVVLSLYEAWSARIAESAGVRILLVGDSLATSVQGHETTLPVTIEDMLYHTRCVVRGAPRSFVIADMPFLTHNVTEAEAVRNAGRFLSEGGAAAVKVEGGAEIAGIVAGMVRRGIPVLGHIGMTPQHVHRFGGYKLQGRNPADARRILADAKALEKAGFRVDRQGKHIFMSKGPLKAVVPRNNPVDAYTMAAIVRDAGMAIEEFKELL